jgi:hypothetical protein
MEEFIRQWAQTFDASSDNSLPQEDEQIVKDTKETLIKFLLNKAKFYLEESIDTCIEAIKNDERLKEWKESQESFLDFLKEKLCVNIDTLEDFQSTYWVTALTKPSA